MNMALLQFLRKRLVAFVSNDNQSVYKRIVDQLEDLQYFYQEMARTAESGVHEGPNTFESKQKEALEDIKNETLESMKYLLNTFENMCVDYYEIMKSKDCIVNHIKEIELQTKADLQVIIHHVQNTTDEFIRTKNNINKIATNHYRVTRTNKITNIEQTSHYKKNMAIIGEQLKYQNAYYKDIINELKSKILLVQEENQKSFNSFSQVASNTLSLQMKCDCVQIVHETCSKMYIKVSDLKKTCQQTNKKLYIKIEKYKSDLSSTKEKCTLLISDWYALQVKSDDITYSITENIHEYIKLNKSLDKCIIQKNKQLNDLNSDYQTICQSEQKSVKKLFSSEEILDNLKNTLTVLEKTTNNYKTEINQQDTNEKKLFATIKDLDERINEFNNKKKYVDFCAVEDNDQISNYAYEFDFTSSEELKSKILMYEEMTKKINELIVEKNDLLWWRDTHDDRLKREREKKEENQKKSMILEVDDRRLQLSDLLNKELENIKVKIPHCQDIFLEAVHMNNMNDNFTKELLTFMQTMMINNHGKTMEKMIQEEEEISASNFIYADNLRDLQRADTEKMEALLEERIQLLQDRMKAITAQREEIEQANRGLEEELDKLSKKFVKMENDVKGQTTNETEEEKVN